MYHPFLDKNTFLDQLTSYIPALRGKYPSFDIIILGDFNIDLKNRTTLFSEDMQEQLIALGFLQQVTLPTRDVNNTSTIIDHVYTRSNRTLRTDIIKSNLSDHYLTLTSYPKWKIRREKVTITKRWFTQDSYTHIRELLAAESWDEMSITDINKATKYLSDKIKEVLDIVAPIETKTVRIKKVNQWTTPGLLVSLKHSHKLYVKQKK